MEFAVLGPLEVRTAVGAVPIRRGLPRTLLVALILRNGQTVSSDFLVDLLWGDDSPRNPTNALQIQISYLRKTLGDAQPEGRSILETRAGGYALVAEREQIDALRFESIVTQLVPLEDLSSSGALDADLAAIDEGLALWRGQALEDLAGADFARGEIARLDELRWVALERRIDLLLRLGRHAAAVGDLSELVQRMPLRERFHEQLVLALYRSGRQADALRAYDEARRILIEELGLDPGIALGELERGVLQHDPSLDWTPSIGPAADETRSTESPDGHSSPIRVPSSRIPIPLSPLIGRDTEVARLVGLLRDHRALTLTGPAGAGKTRLAIELVGRTSEQVWYVDLSPVDDPTLVAPTCATVIGAALTPGEDPVQAVAGALATQSGVLVLDTCEHVLSAAAQLAGKVLRAAPSVHLLATSRRALGLSGEFAWPVPPLALPPSNATSATDISKHAAAWLFIERAMAVRPDLVVDDEVAVDIAAICLALDGLPLAIELAAARADILSASAIRERLDDRFSLLVDGGADAAERQQTLRAAIDWSFDLLSVEQRAFFARLGVFAGTFDLDAALMVAGSGLPQPLELLASLVRQSMVTRAGEERYRLLDTLRAYALDVLAELDADGTRNRHASHFAELAERGEATIRGPDQLVWLERFRSDINNFRAALEWSLLTGDVERAAREAGALAWFWTLNGMLTEAFAHLARLVNMEQLPAAIRARCLWGYALLAASLGQLEVARDAGYLAADLGTACGDATATAYGLNAAAVGEWALGHHERSLDAHREAIEILEKMEDQWGLAICKVLQARTLFDRRDRDAADVAREGVVHARRAGDLHVLGIALTEIAQLRLTEGDYSAAVMAASEALDLQEQIGYTEGTISALHVLGQAQRVAGDIEAARKLHLRALSLASRIGHAAGMCEAVEDLARADATGNPGFARAALLAARAERETRGVPLRQRDAEELAELESSLRTSETTSIDRPFAMLVAELTA